MSVDALQAVRDLADRRLWVAGLVPGSVLPNRLVPARGRQREWLPDDRLRSLRRHLGARGAAMPLPRPHQRSEYHLHLFAATDRDPGGWPRTGRSLIRLSLWTDTAGRLHGQRRELAVTTARGRQPALVRPAAAAAQRQAFDSAAAAVAWLEAKLAGNIVSRPLPMLEPARRAASAARTEPLFALEG